MPVGYQLAAANINQIAGQLSVRWRDLATQTTRFQAAIVGLGADDTARAAALVNAGFTPADATQMVYLANVMNTLAQIYLGNAGQTPPFDFGNALSVLWGFNVGT
jgi:hypothetical protein